MTSKATFGAGCYWSLEAAFRRLEGVTATRVGFAGPTEVVEVTYDPEVLSYEELLDAFWSEHDPTARVWGALYRPVILVHDEAQREAATASRDRLQERLSKQIRTAIEDAGRFAEAGEHDQQYLEKRGLASCSASLANAA